jgi:hypothetical protein
MTETMQKGNLNIKKLKLLIHTVHSEAHIQTRMMSRVEMFFPTRFYLHCVGPEYIPSTGKGTSSTLTD